MRARGKLYWDWADPALHFRNYDERLPCGKLINIQVRLSPQNITQLFFGIYGDKGVMLLEEHYPQCDGQTLSAAMAWALQRAQAWVGTTFAPPADKRPERLPRKGSRLYK
ncbi:hypothetical protein F3J44_28770 [Pantoea sp. Tr-811]|uniref:hypothetical protein n=1 Tax=unclassified Pantoea TaxID=2630326 RepID=UPI0014213A8C|nr:MULTISPECIES: hypothetical protein [unclassified Pantoea]NIE74814.1 hypothetical protein [Pantoea sp. Ap-967]NIF30334.1 hypothetical protein [Pantoea sp. Tr-811]